VQHPPWCSKAASVATLHVLAICGSIASGSSTVQLPLCLSTITSYVYCCCCCCQVPDASYDFVSRNQGLVRSLPLWAGGVGFVGLLANRTLSGVRCLLFVL
jgi:hypothetical protein